MTKPLPKSYKVVSLVDREPPFMAWVVMVDIKGELIVYRRTELGYNLRDATGTHSPNNNLAFVGWLEAEY